MAEDSMLIIFDCDGVLVDSEVLAAQVFADALVEQGLNIDAKTCFATFKGHTLGRCLEILRHQFSFGVPADFIDTLEVKTQLAFASQLKPVAGVRAVLDKLVERGIPFCVASNGGHEKVEHSLTVTGLIDYFPANRFSAEDVARGKPAPDLFLYASEAMGVPTAFCRIIEDSKTGLMAAKAAGMKSYFFGAANGLNSASRIGKEHNDMCVEVEELGATPFDNMDALPSLLL